FRLTGDARSISNAIAVTKMRAASDFSRARLYVDSVGTRHLETFIKPNAPASPCGVPANGCWVAPRGSTTLSQRVSLGWQSLATDPKGAATASAGACLDDAGAAIAGTSCVIFNSRGVPVDSTGAPVATNALYLTDSTAVYAITVEASGMIRLWRSGPT